MAIETVLSQIAQSDPVARAISVANAIRTARAQGGLQQAQTQQLQMQTQLEPEKARSLQALQAAQTLLAQAQAKSAPTEELGKELQMEVAKAKLWQMEHTPSPEALAFQKGDAQALTKYMPDLAKGSEIAGDVLNDVNLLKNAYNRLDPLERGLGAGSLPPVSPAAQEFERLKNNLVVGQIGRMRNVRSSVMLNKLIAQSKLSRDLRPDAFIRRADQIAAGAQRTQEQRKFFDRMVANGTTGFTPVSNAWGEYISHYPLTDPATGDLIPQNIGAWEKEFGSKEAADSASNNQRVLPLGANPPSIPSIHGTRRARPKEGFTDDQIARVAAKLGISVQEAKKRLAARGL
jgi:hypothetical protein